MHFHPDYRLRELDDDHLVIGPDTGKGEKFRHVVRLNASAAFLWRSLEGKEFDIDTLAQSLKGEYDLDAVVAAADAAAILAAWKKSGLVD